MFLLLALYSVGAPIFGLAKQWHYCQAEGVVDVAVWAQNQGNKTWRPEKDMPDWTAQWKEISKREQIGKTLADKCTAYYENLDAYAGASWKKAGNWIHREWSGFANLFRKHKKHVAKITKFHNSGKGCCARCSNGFLGLKKIGIGGKVCKSGMTCEGGFCVAQPRLMSFVRGAKNVVLSPEVMATGVVIAATAGVAAPAVAAGGAEVGVVAAEGAGAATTAEGAGVEAGVVAAETAGEGAATTGAEGAMSEAELEAEALNPEIPDGKLSLQQLRMRIADEERRDIFRAGDREESAASRFGNRGDAFKEKLRGGTSRK